MDAGLLGVEFEALGRIASTVGKNQGKALEKPENRGNPAFSSRIVKFADFPCPKSDRLLDIKTGEVLGEMTRFAWGSTKPSGFNPTPWLTADRCPKTSADIAARTRQFADQVLMPIKDK